MLIQFRRDLLPYALRNPYQLAQHPIFLGHDNTPRKISNISMMLSNSMDLDEIYKILGGPKSTAKNLDKSGPGKKGIASNSSSHVSEELDGAWRVKKDFLHELKQHEDGTYNLLVLCALFTNGLLVSEMEQIAAIINLNPLRWVTFIKSLSLANSVGDIRNIKLDEEELKKIKQGATLQELLSLNFAKHRNFHKMWIDLRSESIEKKDQLRLLVDPSLRKIIMRQS